MTDHTPTPWRISNQNWKPWPGAIGIEGTHPANFEHDTICWTTSGGLENEAANAAFIVKAVNNHAPMDKLLAEAADFLNVSPTMEGMDLGSKITQFRRAMLDA